MPATDDEIREKYLERAIRELNNLSRELQACEHCPRGQLMPVLGSGHPQADIFMLKYTARPSEIEEGVAFYGRTGNALMKSLKRLNIDPLAVYGTLCVKCPVLDPVMADPACIARVAEELTIVAPKIIVVMGHDALGVVNDLDLPSRRDLSAEPGVVQPFTPSDRGAVCAEHRRLARRGDRQAGVLVGVQDARPVVVGSATVLAGGPDERDPPRHLALGDAEPEHRRRAGFLLLA